MDKNELREILTVVKKNNFRPHSAIDISALAGAMLQEIGNIDPSLRDGLIYSVFSSLIIDGYYSDIQLKQFLSICLDDEHLFYGLGEVHTDSVFTRSFSSLIIAAILHVNRQKQLLTIEELGRLCDLLLDYLEKEEDMRGYVPEKGWAHSIAHIADALDELATQGILPLMQLNTIFKGIIDKMCHKEAIFQYDEDERMIVASITLLDSGLDAVVVCEQIRRIYADLIQQESRNDPSTFVYRFNIKQFLRSFYFHLDAVNQWETVRDQIRQTLADLNRLYYR